MKAPVLDLHFTDGSGRRVSLRDMRGQPVVLALAPCVPFDAADEDFVRAELRGLGAALLVVTPRGAWLVGADDAMAEVEIDADLFAIVGVAADRTTLVVLGDDGRVRWQSEADADDLALALARAAAVRRSTPAFLVNRREVLLSALVGALAVAVLPRLAHGRAPDPAAPAAGGGATNRVTLTVNGKSHTLDVEARVTLLDALRETLGLSGTKKGCDHGQCGACTVLVDGKRKLSCLSLAVMQGGAQVTTIEGLARGVELHPMQAAFLEHDAFQCGYCTPGQILSAIGCLSEGKARTPDEIREAMSGNICRCGAYPNIVAAISAVRSS